MFTYDQIIELNKDFSPYYDLLNEGRDTWKRFIITPQFYLLLNNTLDCLEKENVSLWLQGAYGTGKSHATGYLKHLLWLPWKEIEQQANGFHDAQVKHRLAEFRKNNIVFPVVMYGADKITNQIDFGLQIEIGVRNALEKMNVELTIKTDFEIYASTIEEERSNYWEKMIEEELEISELAQDKNQMIIKLRAYDQDLFFAIRDALNRRRRPISVSDIVAWLKDVRNSLQKKGIAEYIMIYWDEFTTILDKRNSEIHEYIQRIAESSQQSGVFLYLISHRTIAQGASKDDRNKLMGRFIDSSYEVSNITTYLLMANSIRKKDYDDWKKKKDKFADKIDHVIEQIIYTEESIEEENLRNLFPIHPYTANIANYVARVMGSTERSIFDFLYDDNTGFKYFISKYPGKEGKSLLTVDYVFDFFERVFDDQDDPFIMSVMQKLRYNESILIKENINYVPLFKALLIMNIAHRKINLNTDHNEIVIPDERNLITAMAGSHLEPHIPHFLSFVDQKKILMSDHKDRFIVEAASYDRSEIDNWVEKNRSKYANIESVFSDDKQKSLFKPLTFNHKRHDVVQCILVDASTPEHLIKNRISTKLKQDYRLNFVVFIARDYNRLNEIHSKVKTIAKDTEQGVCYIVLDTLFTEDHFERFLLFKAQNELAQSKHDEEAALTAYKNMRGQIDQWIEQAVISGFTTWYIKGQDKSIHSEKCSYKDMPLVIDNKLAPRIFYKSFDIMGEYVNITTAWDMKMTKKSAEHFLSSTSLQDLMDKTNSGPLKTAREILFDKNGAHLVNDKLELVAQPREHPLIILIDKVRKFLESDEEINIGDAFAPLFKPPFGYYKNHVFLSAIGFALRPYLGKLYSPSTGEKLNEFAMLDLIEKLFKYQVDNNNFIKSQLAVRIGSEKESALVKLLEEMFDLEGSSSIVDARYKLANKLKNNVKVPLWLFRYSSDIEYELKLSIQVVADKIIPIDSGIASLSPNEFEGITNELLPYRSALNHIFGGIDDKARRKLFLTFGKQNSDISMKDLLEDKLDDLIEFFRQNLQGDPLYWDENKMISTLKDWLLLMLSYGQSSHGNDKVEENDEESNDPKGKESIPEGTEVWELVMEHKEEVWNILEKLVQTDRSFRWKLYEHLQEFIE